MSLEPATQTMDSLPDETGHLANQTANSDATARSSSSSGPLCSSGENTVVRVIDSSKDDASNNRIISEPNSQPITTTITEADPTIGDNGSNGDCSDIVKMLIFQLLNELYTKQKFYKQALEVAKNEDYSHLSKLFEPAHSTNDNVCVSEIVAKTVESINKDSIAKRPEAVHLLKKLELIKEAKRMIVKTKQSKLKAFTQKKLN